MLTKISTKLGVNLALIAHDRKLDLTPKAGSLLQLLSQSTKNALGVSTADSAFSVAALPNELSYACQGQTVSAAGGTNTYACSDHDATMDNYQNDLKFLITQHIGFARSVVMPKVTYLEEAVRAALAGYALKEAEDFFNVHFFALPEVFKSYLVEDEVTPLAGHHNSPSVVNFGDALGNDFDPSVYFITGDEALDAMIQQWVSQLGKDVVLSYLQPKTSNFELGLFGPAALQYHMSNFLLYRQLAIKKDMNLGMSAVQMNSVPGANRDYHAAQLASHLQRYHEHIKSGELLTPDTDLRFSYLSTNKFDLCLYEESFAKLADIPNAMEKIFGVVSDNPTTSVTADLIIKNGEEYARKWQTVRGMYAAYLTSNRATLLRSSLKIGLASSFEFDVGEEKDSPIFDKTYMTKACEEASKYIDTLDSSDADDLFRTCLEVMARRIYGFSNAYFFLREMYEIMKSDPTIDAGTAAHAAVVKYTTDFLLEQVDVMKVSGI